MIVAENRAVEGDRTLRFTCVLKKSWQELPVEGKSQEESRRALGFRSDVTVLTDTWLS